ncbi:MAG: SCO family protein [Ignavibacteria bacterium]|nr:SCO family protein [Ignavibacteria bacterium]
MKDNLQHIFLILIVFFFVSSAFAGDHIEIGIDEQLGSYIPLDVLFKDSEGNDVTLKQFISSSEATVIAFVYYQCPGICSPLLFELSDVVNKFDLELGYDYNIITISMDEYETPEIAAGKKKDFLPFIDENVSNDSWKFLTGDSANIKTVSDAAGFYFRREGDQFRHSGAFIFVDKEGKICRYLFPGYSDRSGFSILPFDFKMALLETNRGKVSPTIARVLRFCFSYDPEGKGYVLNFTRIFGAGILLLAVIFLLFIKFKPKKAFIKAR